VALTICRGHHLSRGILIHRFSLVFVSSQCEIIFTSRISEFTWGIFIFDRIIFIFTWGIFIYTWGFFIFTCIVFIFTSGIFVFTCVFIVICSVKEIMIVSKAQDRRYGHG
jgi:hypothetical protein